MFPRYASGRVARLLRHCCVVITSIPDVRERVASCARFYDARSAASVVVETVAVVTTLDGGIDDAVSAACGTAVAPTAGTCPVTVRIAVVTLFAFVKFCVTAVSQDESAARRAYCPVRQRQRTLALFAKSFLHHSIPAPSALKEALCTASITISDITVFTFFFRIENAVAAQQFWRCRDELRRGNTAAVQADEAHGAVIGF